MWTTFQLEREVLLDYTTRTDRGTLYFRTKLQHAFDCASIVYRLFPFDFIYIYVYIFNLKYKEESGICGEVLLFTRFIEY